MAFRLCEDATVPRRRAITTEKLDDYTVVIKPDDNGAFAAYVPAIQGCHAWGQTADEAHRELWHVFEMVREEYEERDQAMPEGVDLEVGITEEEFDRLI